MLGRGLENTMPTVFVYLAEATYRGPSEFDWPNPQIGARHKLLLFLAQASNAPSEAEASRELSRFGFAQTRIEPGKQISVESLNAGTMRGLHKHYEEALAEGSSVVWYPEVLPAVT